MLEIENLKAEINNKKIIKGLNLKINQERLSCSWLRQFELVLQ